MADLRTRGRRAVLAWLSACLALVAAGVAVASPLVPFRIQLAASGCPGRCPVWTATISLDGSVTFDGLRYVSSPGRHTSRISPAAVQELKRQVDASGFMTMAPAYTGQISEAPTTTLSVLIGSTVHTVHTRGGPGSGAPEALGRLIRAIYVTAGLGRWVGAP